MLKTILFCAILAYLSGVEARRREYNLDTTTPEYGAPQYMRNRYGGRNVGEDTTTPQYGAPQRQKGGRNVEGEDTTTPQYGAPQRQKGGRNFDDDDAPTSWVNDNGHEFFQIDGDEWGYTGDDLTYTLIEIVMFDDGDFEIVLEAEDGLFILLTEDAAYESWDFYDDYTWFADGFYTFDGQRRQLRAARRNIPLIVRVQRNGGERLRAQKVRSSGFKSSKFISSDPRKLSRTDKTDETTTPEYSVRRRSGYGRESPEEETTTPEYSVRRRALRRKSFGGTEIILPEPETTTPEYSVRRRWFKTGNDEETTTPEYSVRRRFGYAGRNVEEEETTTPEYSVRRRFRYRGGKSSEDHTETTTPEYSVRRLAIKRG